MEALVWLAIPVLATGIAAVVLRLQAVRAATAGRDDDADRRRLARIEQVLRQDPAPAPGAPASPQTGEHRP